MPTVTEKTMDSSAVEGAIIPVYVAGNWFVGRAFDLPAGLKGAELNDFVELCLEDISPFSVEQMYAGYMRSSDSDRIFIYAAFDQRLRAEMKHAEQHDYALPDFSQFFGTVFKKPTLAFLLEGTVLTGILFPAEDPVPQAIVGVDLGNEFSENDLEATRNLITRRIENSVTGIAEPSSAEPVAYFSQVDIPTGHYKRNAAFKSSGKKPMLELVSTTGDSLTIPTSASSRLWEYDIRKPDTKEQLIKKQFWDLVLWKTTIVIVFLLLFLGTFEGALIVLNKISEEKTEILNEMSPHLEEVRRNDDILAKINQITNAQLLPFEMVEELNVIRPKNIYFNRLTAEAGNLLRIDAECVGDTSQANVYEERLKALDLLSSVEVVNYREVNDKATFRLMLKFKAGVLLPVDFLEDGK